MRLVHVVAILALVVGATPLHSQRVAPSGLLSSSTTSADDVLPSTRPASGGGETPLVLPVRVALGAAGSVTGAYLGLVVGWLTLGQIWDDCGGCDDPGINGALVGAAGGALFGAAFFAATPRLGSPCSEARRDRAARWGSVIGGLGAAGLGLAIGEADGLAVGLLAGAAIGAAVGVNRCR